MRGSKPDLVLEDTWKHFIIAWFHAHGFSSQSCPSPGSPRCNEALIRTEHGKGSGRLKEWEQMDGMMCFLAISSACSFFSSSFITADRFLHQQPENDHLQTFYTSSPKTKKCLRWRFWSQCSYGAMVGENLIERLFFLPGGGCNLIECFKWKYFHLSLSKPPFLGWSHAVWPAVLAKKTSSLLEP